MINKMKLRLIHWNEMINVIEAAEDHEHSIDAWAKPGQLFITMPIEGCPICEALAALHNKILEGR